jgi:diaminohydroxyphosphoribosylaminopyrimidine deaminase/5-amino-6-(5-phosphoribosylamino)uracil reductase
LIISHEISRVIVAARDPNPNHSGAAFPILRKAGVKVSTGLLGEEAENLNESFNYWIQTRRPFILLKAAMTLDGKIATSSGDSKWITGDKARQYGMHLRLGADAILVGINTVLRDNPSLTLRGSRGLKFPPWKKLKRFVLDPTGKISPEAAVLQNQETAPTTVVLSGQAPAEKIKALKKTVEVIIAPLKHGKLDLNWFSKNLGQQGITNLLVEGGGETHAEFLGQGLGNKIAFFYAPMIIAGRNAPKGVGGKGLPRALSLKNVVWRKLGPDLLLTAAINRNSP